MKRRPPLTRSGRLPRVAMVTRAPVPGAVKTRLAPALGREGAAALHRRLARQVALEVACLGACGEAEAEVWHDGWSAAMVRRWLGPAPRYRPQPHGDLGARLAAIFSSARREGAPSCAIVGSDCPGMTSGHLRQALAHLQNSDLVLGPACDGGYWLIGLTAAAMDRAPRLMSGIPWGSSQVFAATMERAAALSLAVTILPRLPDVDRPEDLHLVEEPAGSISVVIPTLREGATIARLVEDALAGGAAQAVVADGGSDDATVGEATRVGAEVIRSPRGRAAQMNAGARAATGDVLLFLHADTSPPPGFGGIIRRTLAEPGVVAGAFSFKAAGGGPLVDLTLTAGASIRCGISGHPYGDQGLFMTASIFRGMGGFPELPVMEDWELVRRLKRLGEVRVVPERATTSAASFVSHGVLWSTAVNLAVIGGYQAGVDPRALARWRQRIARRG